MNINISKKTSIIFIIIYTLIVGAAAIIVFPEFNGSDATTYDGIAMNIVEQGKFIEVHNQITPPLYPVFLSIIFKIFGHSFIAVYIAQIFLLLGINILIFLISKKYLRLPNLYALAVSIITSSWPYMLLFVMQRLTETLYIFWLTLIVYQLFNFIAHPKLKNSLILGLLFALATHTRPVILFLLPWLLGIAILIYLQKRYYKKDYNKIFLIIKYGLVGLLLFIFLCLPYTIYGSLKAGKFVPIASNISTINKRANITMDKEWFLYQTHGYELGSEFTYTKLIKIKIKNIYRFWDSGADGKRAELVTSKIPLAKYLISIYTFGFYLIVMLALASIMYIKKNKSVLLIWLVILYFWLLHTALFPFPRYTLPIIPLIIALALYSTSELIQKYKIKHQ
ncbi:MAG: glycosyltransferase family 39 protein [Patescibacteria group bacterium]|nr:glycosyltransferase family 39 protein [Patescibacteria group bacterium]